MKGKLLSTSKLLFLFVAFISATNTVKAQKLRAFVIQPPEVVLQNVKKIAIINADEEEQNKDLRYRNNNLKGDVLSDYIVAGLLQSDRGIGTILVGLSAEEGQTYIDGFNTNVFKLVERSQIQSVIEEQGFTLGGLVNQDQASTVGELLGIDAFVFVNSSFTSSDKADPRTYKGKTTYRAVRTVNVEARIKVVSVETGEILATTDFKTSVNDSKSNASKYDAIRALKPATTIADEGLKKMTNQILNYFAPSFTYKKFKFEKIKVKEFKDDVKKAEDYLDEGKINEAYQVYKQVYDNDPYNPKAAYNMGIFYEAVGDFDNAVTHYGTAYQLDPDEDDYGDAYKNAQKGQTFTAELKHYGITIQPHDWSLDAGVNLNATKVKTDGSSKDRVNVYKDPIKDADVVAKVPGGLEFEVIEQEGEWYKIKLLGGDTGYLHQDDLD